MNSCQNLRYQDKLLCHNHWRIRDKLYTYQIKYGDLKQENENIKKTQKKAQRRDRVLKVKENDRFNKLGL